MNCIACLTCVSVYRSMALSTRAHTYLPRSTTHMYIMLTFCWMWSISLSLPPLAGWGAYRPEQNGMSCAPSWRDSQDRSYNIFLFSTGFFLPLIIIFTTSLTVILTIRQNISTILSSDIRAAAMERQYRVVKMVRHINLHIHTM